VLRKRFPFFVLTLAGSASIIWLAIPNVAAQADEPPTILISRQLATSEGVRVGDTVALSSKPDGSGARSFRVAGI
jgi:ABC-type lipoprotein release transport system permease subunit